MNSTRTHGEKSGYLVIMLLVVGLTAFSHSVKELMEIHHLLTSNAGRLIAQWSGNVTPAQIPQTIVKIEKHASCDIKQSAPSVELSWLNEMPAETEPSLVAPRRPARTIQKIAPRVIVRPSEAEIARLKKLHRFEIDSDEFEVRVFADAQNEDAPVALELPLNTFKAKARKHGIIRINPRDHEMLLKTLNRSINLRIAG